ncbi:alpha/beta hydrolase [Amycolatopsis sp. H20-H5]|uniref:alpha/beta hydrolase n=1 Tax=Amycolatopsis sp. H20-H5 TaxID=3046309 RepID=UPI002DBD82D1|nr:alpha/beta hydrolase [Amycolatopsis sp. H20-H5]MEC3981022.1 alpha/beta hydrolase [Amycolatopsis sp. H20-H5]
MSTDLITTDHQSIDPDISATLDAIARAIAHGTRSPLLHTPAEEGLDFTDFSFPSTDGTPLEAWFIPRAVSDRLIICAHAFGFSRAGFPSGIEPWKSSFGVGNDYDINFVADYKVLHDHGYNVLAFDFRNFGQSGTANGGVQSAFRFEARDVRGALDYVRNNRELADMKTGIFARCMGANATFRAIHDDPAAFSDVRALVAPLLLSPRLILEHQLTDAGLGQYVDEVDRRQQLFTSVTLADSSPIHWAPSVAIPTLTYGVRHDHLVEPWDLESTYDAVAAKDKDMFWIEDSTSRWDGYTWFQRHPERIIEFFDARLSS